MEKLFVFFLILKGFTLFETETSGYAEIQVRKSRDFREIFKNLQLREAVTLFSLNRFQ